MPVTVSKSAKANCSELIINVHLETLIDSAIFTWNISLPFSLTKTKIARRRIMSIMIHRFMIHRFMIHRFMIHRFMIHRFILFSQLNEDQDARDGFEKRKGELLREVERREAQVDALKKALALAERATEAANEEKQRAVNQLKDMADKVYSLMDNLKLNQGSRSGFN